MPRRILHQSWQSDHDESLPDARATCRVAATTIIWNLLGTTLMKGYCSWLRKCQLSENTMWPCQFWISRTTTTTTITTTTTATFTNNNLHKQQPQQQLYQKSSLNHQNGPK